MPLNIVPPPEVMSLPKAIADGTNVADNSDAEVQLPAPSSILTHT